MSRIDDAQRIEQHLREAAISTQLEKSNKPGVEFEHCQECGVDIPKARREAIKNCNTCVNCQELIESNQKHYRA